jgi:hypothetical protein
MESGKAIFLVDDDADAREVSALCSAERWLSDR